MLLAKAFQPAAGGIAAAIVLGVAVLVDDRLGCQRDDFLEIGMDQGGTQQLMGISDAAAAMMLLQARVAMDFAGGEIGRAVQRQEVMPVQIDERFECLAALQAAEDVLEQGPQVVGIDRVEDVPHLRVAGDVVDAVDGAKDVVGIAAALVKSQEGRILEGEHGKGGHQCVAQGYFGASRARFGKGFKTGADQLEKGVSGKLFACLPGGGWGNHGQILLPECESRQTSEGFCHRALRRASSEWPIFHWETQRPGIAVIRLN